MELKTQVMQKITLSANMQQCLEILAMDNVQLGEYITEQSMENPIIELADSGMCAEYSQAAIRAEREQPEDEEESGREIYCSLRVGNGISPFLLKQRMSAGPRASAV